MSRALPILNGESKDATTGEGACSTPHYIDGVTSPAVQGKRFRGRAAVVTLGCAKNQVDSEVMIGTLAQAGYELVTDLNRAEVAIVNTCGFLQSAIDESLGCIRDLAALKRSGSLRKLVVAGCLVGRFGKDIPEGIPEVDLYLGPDDLPKLAQGILGESIAATLNEASRPYFLYDETTPRIRASAPHYAYVKISEGCNRPCAFCIIPKIRGAMHSRPADSIVREVQRLASEGVREVNLIAQDLTAFGEDREGGERLPALLRRLERETTISWIRLLYAYPLGISEELLSAIGECSRVVKYLDLPLQHASLSVLRAMRRPGGKYAAGPLVEFIKGHLPEVALRTTFIVGFPGETESDVEELAALVRSGPFMHVGVFTYSPEKGTPGFEMEGQISTEEKDARRNYILETQQKALRKTLRPLKGQRVPVLIEGAHPESAELLVGRTPFQAPEVDGITIINRLGKGSALPPPGTLGTVRITDIAGYDLVGTFEERSGHTVAVTSEQQAGLMA